MKDFKVKIILVIHFAIFLHFAASAQVKDSFSTTMIGIATSGTQAIIRWSPNSMGSWTKGKNNGYKLYRYTVKANGVELSDSAKNASKQTHTFSPLSQAEWESLISVDSVAGVAAGALFGERFVLQQDTANFANKLGNMETENQNRYGLSLFAADRSIATAKAMGLYFKDTTVQANSLYLYTSSPTGSSLLEGYCYINTNDLFQGVAPTNLQKIAADSINEISWEEAIDMPYLGYYIERSDNNGGTYTQLNTQPLVRLYSEEELTKTKRVMFRDILPNNTQDFVYRVRGKTIFDTFGPYSDTIHSKGIPPPIPIQLGIDSVKEVNVGKLKLFWSFPDTLNSKIGGFTVWRSKRTIDGVYEKLTNNPLAVTTRSFEDQDPFFANYYKISTIDINGHELISFASLGQPKDTIPPGAPTGLKGKPLDSKSVTIRLDWNRSPEADVKGYRVYYSNLYNGDYTQETSNWISDTSFQFDINLSTLSRYIYVKVLALDYRENHSIMSAAVAVQIPDIVPPNEAVIYKAEPQDRSISLTWYKSSANDLKVQKLQRISKFDASWITIRTYAAGSDPTFPVIDSALQSKTNYKYRVVSIDSSDLFSNSNEVTVRGLGIQVPNIEILKAEYFSRAIKLTWLYPDLPEVMDFQVYRSLGAVAQNSPTQNVSNQEKLVLAINPASALVAKMKNPYNSSGTPGGGTSIADLIQYNKLDQSLSNYKGQVKYRIVVRFKDGTYSEFSQQVSVQKL